MYVVLNNKRGICKDFQDVLMFISRTAVFPVLCLGPQGQQFLPDLFPK